VKEVAMAIVKQVDPTYNDPFVAFVESEPNYIKGHAWEERVNGERYSVSVHEKPLRTDKPMGFAWCKHRHRSIDAAVTCAKRMLLLARSRALA